MPEPTAPAAQPQPTSPAPDASAGEEDPGAALDDPALRDALRGEAERSGTNPAAPADTPGRVG